MAGRPLVDRLLGRAGLDSLAEPERIPGDWRPLLWYSVAVAAVEVIGLQGYNVAAGRTPVFVDNPLWLLRPVILLAAAVATWALHHRYDRAVRRSRLLERAGDPARFHGLTPDWLAGGIILVGIAFTLLNALVGLTIPQLYEVGGPARVVRFLVVTPFGYVPVLGSFLATYVAVEVLVPRRLAESDVGLDFLDPERLGGMRPIGELVKYAYYYVMLGLIAYAVAVYGPHVLEGALAYEGLEPPGTAINLAFSVVWAATVGTMTYGIYVLHRYMTREKREALDRLDRRAREHLDRPWEIERVDTVDFPDEFERYREKVAYVSQTKEYPATFTMWTQLVVGVVLPKAIQVFLAAI